MEKYFHTQQLYFLLVAMFKIVCILPKPVVSYIVCILPKPVVSLLETVELYIHYHAIPLNRVSSSSLAANYLIYVQARCDFACQDDFNYLSLKYLVTVIESKISKTVF